MDDTNIIKAHLFGHLYDVQLVTYLISSSHIHLIVVCISHLDKQSEFYHEKEGPLAKQYSTTHVPLLVT